MSKTKQVLVGIIAEDDSDVESVKILIHRIVENERIGIRKFVGKGCGKINRKAKAWAENLKVKGCNILILIHDLDRNNFDELKNRIEISLQPCPINKFLISIPIKELEAWLLSDPEAIKSALNLKKLPKIEGNTYDITNPKEFLEKIVYTNSDKEKRYLNTVHNKLISKELSIEKVKSKNPSFVPFYEFIKTNIH